MQRKRGQRVPSKTAGSELERLLSPDPAVRELEVAFLARIIATSHDASIAALRRAQEGRSVTFAAEFGRMQSAVWERLADLLASDIPLDAGFGQFRHRDKDSHNG